MPASRSRLAASRDRRVVSVHRDGAGHAEEGPGPAAVEPVRGDDDPRVPVEATKRDEADGGVEEAPMVRDHHGRSRPAGHVELEGVDPHERPDQ